MNSTDLKGLCSRLGQLLSRITTMNNQTFKKDGIVYISTHTHNRYKPNKYVAVE